ncbi:MAG: cell division protein FtsQ [Tannerellaceae bacterium]|nr:cell division protein FtsQ [Tannerellaceae bacterium]
MTLRIISVIIAVILCCYLVFVSFFFRKADQEHICDNLIVLVKDSLDKHFVTQQDLISILRKAELNPIGKPLSAIRTDQVEEELLRNEMIAQVEAYKTPAGSIKLEVKQKAPLLRIITAQGSNYYVDNMGSTMPISRKYAAHVPVATGYITKEMATGELYQFALFLKKNDFWQSQIEQIYVQPTGEITLIPKVGDHRILLGTFENYQEKLDNLQVFYEQAIPKVGWDKYSTINLKFKDQIVCTKK